MAARKWEAVKNESRRPIHLRKTTETREGV